MHAGEATQPWQERPEFLRPTRFSGRTPYGRRGRAFLTGGGPVARIEAWAGLDFGDLANLDATIR